LQTSSLSANLDALKEDCNLSIFKS